MGTKHIIQYKINISCECQYCVLYEYNDIKVQTNARFVRETVVYRAVIFTEIYSLSLIAQPPTD
jgi:biotin synthase-like enzyme